LQVLGLTGEKSMTLENHNRGFEKEFKLREIYAEVSEIEKSLYQWKDFMVVAKLINPELCEGAYVRRPCNRKLRYTGEGGGDGFFVPGNIYNSTDFNGATYSIKRVSDVEEERVIGFVYFEFIED
jgi:hypothetical protein